MHLLKRLTFLLAVSVVSFGAPVAVSPTSIYAHAVTPPEQELIDLIDQRLAPLIEERNIWSNAVATAFNAQVATFFLDQAQAINVRIASLEAVKTFIENNPVPPGAIDNITLVIQSIVSPDIPSVL